MRSSAPRVSGVTSLLTPGSWWHHHTTHLDSNGHLGSNGHLYNPLHMHSIIIAIARNHTSLLVLIVDNYTAAAAQGGLRTCGRDACSSISVSGWAHNETGTQLAAQYLTCTVTWHQSQTSPRTTWGTVRRGHFALVAAAGSGRGRGRLAPLPACYRRCVVVGCRRRCLERRAQRLGPPGPAAAPWAGGGAFTLLGLSSATGSCRPRTGLQAAGGSASGRGSAAAGCGLGSSPSLAGTRAAAMPLPAHITSGAATACFQCWASGP